MAGSGSESVLLERKTCHVVFGLCYEAPVQALLEISQASLRLGVPGKVKVKVQGGVGEDASEQLLQCESGGAARFKHRPPACRGFECFHLRDS